MLFRRSILTSIATFLVGANAASLQIPITYEGVINMNYYFKGNDGTVTSNNQGLLVTANEGQDLLTVLTGAEIVYSIETSTEKILLAADCYDVYQLADSEGNLISWDSCQEFPTIEELIASSASAFAATHSASASSSSSTVVATSSSSSVTSGAVSNAASSQAASSPAPASTGGESQSTATATSTSATSTGSTLETDKDAGSFPLPTSYTIVTTTIDQVETVYTTTCPLSYTTTVVTTTSNGVVTSYTTYCPISSSSIQEIEVTKAVTTVNAGGDKIVYSSTSKTNFIADTPESVTVPLPTAAGELSSLTAKVATLYSTKTGESTDDEVTTITRYQVITTTEGSATKTLTVPTVLVTNVPKATTGTSATTAAVSGTTVVEEQASYTSASVDEFQGAANRLSTGTIVGLVAGAISLLL